METTIHRPEEGSAVVQVKGRFTTDESEGFLKAVEPLLGEKLRNLSLELSQLDFISSSGIRSLVMILKNCQANGTVLTLRNLTPQLKDILTLTALIDKFNVE